MCHDRPTANFFAVGFFYFVIEIFRQINVKNGGFILSESETSKKSRVGVGTILGLLLCIILIPALIINVTLIVKSFLYPEEVPSFMGYKPFIVLTGSMEPVFYSGDLVMVKEVEASSLQIGDVIAFREGTAVITHRIVQVEGAGKDLRFITKGDNNNVNDRRPVTVDQLEGIYLYRISKLGNFAMFMQTPVGMALFIALPLLSFILYDILRRTLFERKKAQRTKELEAELESMRQQLEASSKKEDSTKQE
jgi:signal peptidase